MAWCHNKYAPAFAAGAKTTLRLAVAATPGSGGTLLVRRASIFILLLVPQ
jgi:hypothetical protein